MMPGHPQSPHDHDVDLMVRGMKRANRKPLFIALGVVVGVALLGGLQVLRGRSVALQELQSRGYSELEIHMKGPFTWSFSGKKGTAECAGTIERVLFSMSISESCFDVAPAAPVPTTPEHEDLAAGIQKTLSSLPVAEVRCSPVDAGATKRTCSVRGKTGTPLEVELAKSDGAWSIQKPARMVARETLAEAIAKELEGKVKAPVVVDCGAGLFGYGEGDTLKCSGSRKGAKAAGSLVVKFGAGAGYTWEATGV
jgi:hypothetical protein